MKINVSRKNLYETTENNQSKVSIPFEQLSKNQQSATLELIFKNLNPKKKTQQKQH
jgi:hypothetical protein